MTGRFLPQRDYASIKAVFRQLVRLCGGPTAVARITRVSQQHISRYQSSEEEFAEAFPPADVIADCEAECGNPIFTRLLAEQSGFMLVPVPKAHQPSDVAIVARVSQLLGEMSDVTGGVAAALKDGKVTTEEAADMHREILEAMGVLAQLDTEIKTRSESEVTQ